MSVYYNKPQARSMLIEAAEEYAVWGRGTGKSTGLIAPRTVSNVFSMPRSLGVYVASTYQQLLTRTLPGVIQGLNQLGYVRDRDYFFGEFAPKKWKWDLPYMPPLKPQYFMHWRNGSGIALVSQDRPGSANGLSIDWLIGDEAKYLNSQRYHEELLPANRGNAEKFGHLAAHHSILLCTDMPTTDSATWLLDKEKVFLESKNQKRLQELESLINFCYDTGIKLKEGKYNASSANRMLGYIDQAQRKMNEMRKGDERLGIPPLVYFSKASTFDNIDVLGVKYIEQMRRTLPWHIYKTSILNERMDEVVQGFYPDLSDRIHGYEKFDNSVLEGFGFDFEKASDINSTHDGDVMHDQPLHAALDYGGSYIPLVAAQRSGMDYRLLKSMGVNHPLKLSDLAKEFKKYYRHHKAKVMYYWYDHTAIAKNPSDTLTYKDIFVAAMRASDEYGSWVVIEQYIGQAPGHHFKYEFLSNLFKGNLSVQFSFNRHNAMSWYTSCKLAPMMISKGGYEKDKRSERRSGPQERATHLSDAGDTLIIGMLRNAAQGESTGVGSMFG